MGTIAETNTFWKLHAKAVDIAVTFVMGTEWLVVVTPDPTSHISTLSTTVFFLKDPGIGFLQVHKADVS